MPLEAFAPGHLINLPIIMNYKTIIFVLFSIFIETNINAGIIIEESNLDTCLVEVLYERFKVTDTLDIKNKFVTNYLTLRAGNDASAFYSAKRKSYDSISSRTFEATIALLSDKEAFRKMSEEAREVIFKLKKERRTIVHDRFDITNWYYEEPYEEPVWEITDSIDVINGLNCVKAMTSFRGRIWIAWFAPEIPLPEGPWKLCGLPGLIIYAYDTKGHYGYKAKRVTTKTTGYVELFNYSERNKTTRLKALKLKRKSLQESIAEKIKASGAFGIDPKPQNSTKLLEQRNYDFEETDYEHN